MPFDPNTPLHDLGLALQRERLIRVRLGKFSANLTPEVLMNVKKLNLSAITLAVFVGMASAAVAQVPVHLSGLINDYTPSTVSGGPWTIHGQWSIDLQGASGTGNFAAELTMSDFGSTNGVPDPAKPGNSPHTHHIQLTNVTVYTDPQTLASCPADKPATVHRLMISGAVSLITANGNDAPFETAHTAPTSVLTVCVSGGDVLSDPTYAIPYSNVTLQFSPESKAVSHFGSQPIHGVVSATK